MSIVIPRAPQANRQRTELPITCNRVTVDLADDRADERSIVRRDGLESQARSPTGIRLPPDPRKYINGYEQLSKLGVGFYPIHLDKSPAVEGKLDQEVSTDPIKIRFWAEYRHHRSFAIRIPRGCRLMVIDTESPFKHPGKPGPDGEMDLSPNFETNG